MVRLEGGALTVDRQRAGRGAWLCRDSPACLDQAERRQAFERAFAVAVDGRQVDEIRSALGTEPADGRTGLGESGHRDVRG